jgi:hypothetical protein
LRTKIALNGLYVFIRDTEGVHVPERSAVLGQANIFHKRVVAVSDHPLQLKAIHKIDLCLPAARLEDTLADVIVIVCTCKGEVVGQ